MDWMKIVLAITFGAMLVFYLPRVKHMIKNSPKGSSSDWQTFFLLIVGVLGFVLLLIWMVRN